MPGMTEEKIAERRRCARDFADQARTISNTLFDRIDKFSLKTFGWIGFAGLLLTVIFTLSTIEDSTLSRGPGRGGSALSRRSGRIF